MQVTGDSTKGFAEQSIEDRVAAQKKLVEELKMQWKQLWSERLNDKVRAEDISGATYERLRVERGTIIHASRDFKPLSLKEILNEHMVEKPENFLQPDVAIGGWTKFVKTEIAQGKPRRATVKNQYVPEKKAVQQPKKGGRGWLHVT